MQTGTKSLYYILYVVIIIGLILSAFSWIDTNCDNARHHRETWFNYRRPYFNEHSTGYDIPVGEKTFYTMPVYRKPYRWPLGFKTRHPVEHIQPIYTQGM